MTYQEAVKYATTKLEFISESCILDAQLLVCEACGINPVNLFTHPEKTLSNKEGKIFDSLLTRRMQGEPIAYIFGKKEFWSLDFYVNEQVLIPRPETELLVEITLNIISNIKAPRILDLGTGSGAIAISIAKERHDAFVVATDMSTSALKIAKTNAAMHQVNVQFKNSNWFERLSNESYDVIVCNPPYVATDDPYLDNFVMEYEPVNAISSNKNGLQDLEIVISGAENYLRAQGILAVEHGFQQAQAVQRLFEYNAFSNIETHQDLSNLDRVTLGNL